MKAARRSSFALVLLIAGVIMVAPWAQATPGLDEWTTIGPYGGDRYKIYIDPVDPDVLYSLSFTVHKSLDAGENWFPIDKTDSDAEALGLMAYSLSFDPTDHETIYMGTLYGVYKTVNGGEMWTPINEGIPLDDQIIRMVLADATDPLTVYASISRVYVYEIDSTPLDIGAAIYRSQDGGATWSPFDTGIPEPYRNITTIYQNPLSLELFAATHGDGIFRYDDVLEEWVPVNTGLSVPEGLYIIDLAFDPSNGDVMYASTQKDWVYKTIDGGALWEAIPYPLPLEAPYPPMAYFSVVDPNNSDYLWVSAFPGGGSNNESPFYHAEIDQDLGGFFLSRDGGVSWELVAWVDALPDAGPFGFTIDPSEVVGEPPYNRSSTYYAATGGILSLLKSTDGAVTYERKAEGVCSITNDALEQHPVDSSIMIAAEEGAMEFSFDGGGSWTYFKPVVDSGLIYVWDVGVDPLNPNMVYYATGEPAWDKPGQKGLYRVDLTTIDPGLLVNDGPGERIPGTGTIGIWKVYLLENGAIYIATQSVGVRKTEDYGDTWDSMLVGFEGLSVTSIAFDELYEPILAGARLSNGKTKYTIIQAGGEEGGVFKWNPTYGIWQGVAEELITSAVYELVNVPDDPLKIYVASQDGVFFTPDGGDTWEDRSWGLPRTNGMFWACDIAIHPDDPDILFVSSQIFGVYASCDGGLHWTAYREGLNQTHMQKLVINWAFPNILYSSTACASTKKCVMGSHPEVDLVTANSVPLSEPYAVTLDEEELIEIYIEGHDPDGDTITYSAYLNDDLVPAPWEVPEPDETYTFDPDTHLFRWTPPHMGGGRLDPLDLSLKLYDGVMARYAAVEITVEPIHPPEIDWIEAEGVPLTEPYATSVVEEEFIEIQISASDVDGDTLTYTAVLNGEDVLAPWEVSDPDEEATFDPNTHIFRWAPLYGYSPHSPFSLSFMVTDGRFTIAAVVEITVDPIHPPEVEWITADGVPLTEPYEASVDEEEFIEVQIAATDADGDTLTYFAQFNGEPVPAPWEVPEPDDVATFDPNTRIFRWAPLYGHSPYSPFMLYFMVTDGRFTTSPLVEIMVDPIHPPEVDWITADGVPLTEPYGASVDEEAFIEVQIEATDADGDTLTYSASFNGEDVPAPWEVPEPDDVATFDPDTHIFRWAPPYGYSPYGPFQLYLFVTDDRFSIYAPVEITVEPIHPPELDWITADGVPLTDPYQASVVEEEFIELQIEAFDIDGDTLTYSARLNGMVVPAPWEVPVPDDTFTFDPETHIFRWAPFIGSSPGSPHSLQFVVTDGRFTIAPSVALTVEPALPMEFMLTMDTAYSEGVLILDFTLAAPEPVLWLTYLVLTSPTVQVIQLWVAQMQIIYPAAEIPIVFPFESAGTVGIFTALYGGGAIITSELEWVDTGAPAP